MRLACFCSSCEPNRAIKDGCFFPRPMMHSHGLNKISIYTNMAGVGKTAVGCKHMAEAGLTYKSWFVHTFAAFAAR